MFIFRISLRITVHSHVLYMYINESLSVNIFLELRCVAVVVKLRNFSNAAADVIIFKVDYCLKLCSICSHDRIFLLKFLRFFLYLIFLWNIFFWKLRNIEIY